MAEALSMMVTACNAGLRVGASGGYMGQVRALLIILFLVAGFAYGAFIPPADGPLPFRRDKLPVDADTMSSLSRQLVILAEHTNTSDETSQRALAQMLALSLALDPANVRARELVTKLKKREIVASPDKKALQAARNRVWNLLPWLLQPEAGLDGRALGFCLGDVLVIADPGHPKAEDLKAKGEQGKWTSWVASADAFRDEEPKTSEEKTTEDPEEIESVPEDVSPIILATASVPLPLWYYDKDQEKMVFGSLAVEMAALIKSEEKGVSVALPGENMEEENRRLTTRVAAFLESKYGNLPEGLHFKISMPGGISYSYTRNGNLMAAAVIVLADAALSGKSPAAALILAEVEEDGSLKLPLKFWQRLRNLAEQEKGSRLILPAAAKDFLPPLVTLDQAEFFMTFEVFLAKDVNALCELASSELPQRISEAEAEFATICKVRGTYSLGSFLNLPATQQRLRQVMKKAPEHSSAGMLALRGTSKWPKRLPREIYAREVRAAMVPMGVQMNKDRDTLLASELDQAEAECRENLTTVDKLEAAVIDRQELQVPAQNAAKLLGNLADRIKRNSEDNEGNGALAKAAKRSYVQLIQSLTQAAGDGDDYPVPTLDP